MKKDTLKTIIAVFLCLIAYGVLASCQVFNTNYSETHIINNSENDNLYYAISKKSFSFGDKDFNLTETDCVKDYAYTFVFDSPFKTGSNTIFSNKKIGTVYIYIYEKTNETRALKNFVSYDASQDCEIILNKNGSITKN